MWLSSFVFFDLLLLELSGGRVIKVFNFTAMLELPLGFYCRGFCLLFSIPFFI